VSLLIGSEGASAPLDLVLRRAGAVFATRDGRTVAIHYGSAAGELAVCVTAVGLVDRSSLTKLVIEAPPASLSYLTSHLAGGEVAPGGALHGGGAWWCGDAPNRVVVLCEPATGHRLVDRIRMHAMHQVVHRVRNQSADLAAIGLLGPSAKHVLSALGAYGPGGDPRMAAPFAPGTIGAIEVSWLLASDRSALALVRSEAAAEAWRLIEAAGRPFGISCVGHEAAGRFELLERSRASRSPALVA
jgi:glycine cleavage system aminomethyltransferase T